MFFHSMYTAFATVVLHLPVGLPATLTLLSCCYLHGNIKIPSSRVPPRRFFANNAQYDVRCKDIIIHGINKMKYRIPMDGM